MSLAVLNEAQDRWIKHTGGKQMLSVLRQSELKLSC
jgi:hypothetical protein